MVELSVDQSLLAPIVCFKVVINHIEPYPLWAAIDQLYLMYSSHAIIVLIN